MAHVLIAGAGYIGLRLAELLAEAGHRVTGLRRTPPDDGPAWLAADVLRPETLAGLPRDLDAVVSALAPSGRDEQAYREIYVTGTGHLLDALPERALSFLCVSSTGVYGRQDGAWVDEDTPAEPATATGRVLLEAEEQVLARRPDASVVRFSGIYGPGRTWLVDRVRAGEPVQADPPAYTNRIHRDDGAGVLAHLLDRALRGEALPPRVVASDDDPAPQHEVADWLAGRLGVPAPPRTTGGPRNKRCRNTLLRSLGYAFRYPGFRDGYGAMLTPEEGTP
jgi:nucleoside-diphosphate-sugar epimerase